MIEITCTSCKRALSIDDAFAGGVCRCQFCGTIQTVPARGAAQKSATAAAKTKTLFENKARTAGAGIGSGSGLEDLADIVQSSGLSNADLRKPKSSAPPPPPPKNLTPLLGLSVGVIVVLLVLVLFLVLHNNSPAPKPVTGENTSNITTDNNPSPAQAAAAPSFCGVPIDQPVVVYVIDNGSSSADVFDAVKTALFHSIDSLGPDRKFQILFWNPDTPAYPSSETTFAVKENVDVAKKKLLDVTASGSTDPVASLTSAFGNNPGQIILITAKAGELDDSLVSKVMALRGTSKSKIDCIAINGVPDDKVLAKIASQTGGQFLPITDSKLRSFAF
jgi:hypothetical protein